MAATLPSTGIVISGSGLWTPPNVITNAELVASYNAWVEKYNAEHAAEIASGKMEEKPTSSERFIEKASGIKSRFVYTREGILDIDRMRPKFPERKEEELSNQAEIAVYAAREAMAAAGKTAADIDAVIVACAYTQRAYPAIAIEVQNELGIEGFGFDMLLACSAATFGLHRACDSLLAGSAKCVLAVNPELVTPQVNFRDRDSHFIFGDVSTAVILERAETCTSANSYEILGTRALTKYSINIRSNFGHMSYANDVDPFGPDKLFHQSGRKVFEEVSPVAAKHMSDHLASLGLTPKDVRRFWIHQANINMNKRVMKQLLGEEPSEDVAPTILDRYANTASAGSIIAFNLYNGDLKKGDIGVICSFGAGYSVGSLVVRRR
ncbi:MAG: 3-oxoacyl-(acyl-carrier-protein) synthase 3 [Syntrophaceae bacterium PtaB.Bin038]|jgi:beta-ketodecanoyl-[acyl-carrier-protein] synthase|nr:MAG: 3-oxoacyl-(acyl-carrier-protein) synthase 3 [Syntrophaceae bacterium PtaB.Bin038]